MRNRTEVGPADYIMELFGQDAEKGVFKTNYKSPMRNVIIDIDPFKTIYNNTEVLTKGREDLLFIPSCGTF